MREGTLRREIVFRTPTGKRIRLASCRLVSFHHRHLAAAQPAPRHRVALLVPAGRETPAGRLLRDALLQDLGQLRL